MTKRVPCSDYLKRPNQDDGPLFKDANKGDQSVIRYRITKEMLNRYGFEREHMCTSCNIVRYVQMAMQSDYGKTPEDLKNNIYNIELSKDVLQKSSSKFNGSIIKDKECCFIFHEEK